MPLTGEFSMRTMRPLSGIWVLSVAMLNACGGGGSSAQAPVVAPSVTLTANPSSISEGGTSSLTWTAVNATACQASGGWSGTQPASGNLGSGTLTTTTSYTLTCTGAGGTNGTATATVNVITASQKIKHVVVIFQENRTPDNLFHGLPGADIADSGVNSAGQTIALQQGNLATTYDLSHAHSAFVSMYAGGKMNGANLIPCIPSANTVCPSNPQFVYVDPAQVVPYFDLAQQYTFGDRMFQSNQGPSFPAHQYIISGTSAPSVGGTYGDYFAAENPGPTLNPTGCVLAAVNQTVFLIDPAGVESVQVAPCFEHPTLIDSLDNAGVTWRYYAPNAGSIWTGPNAIRHLATGPDWANVIMPQSKVLTDIAAGDLAQVVWVIPDGTESDHANLNDGTGPSWVASVVNAIGASQYWTIPRSSLPGMTGAVGMTMWLRRSTTPMSTGSAFP